MSNYAVGLQRMKDILGSRAEQIAEKFQKISPDFADYVVKLAYGDFYSRPLISDKMKELAAVANLMGQGQTGPALKSHIHGMLNVGWTKEEVLEVIIFLVAYSGFPTSVDTLMAAGEVFESKG